MKKRTNRLEKLYKKLKRDLTDSTVYDLVISKEKDNIKYNPNYQRNYIWNITKAVNLIETVLINGEIPPMTALTRSEITRAKYLYDDITIKFIELFEKEKELYNQCLEVLLPKTKRNLDEREKVNLLLVTIREVLVMRYIPIIEEKSVRIGASIFDKYYATFINTLMEREKSEKVNEFIKIFKKLYLIKEKLNYSNDNLKDNVLFFKSLYWMFAILYKIYPNEFYDFNINQLCHYVENGGQIYFDNYKNITPESIENRHAYMKKYINEELKLDINDYICSIKKNKQSIKYKKTDKIKSDQNWNGIGSSRQVMTVRDTLKMSEIIRLI